MEIAMTGRFQMHMFNKCQLNAWYRIGGLRSSIEAIWDEFSSEQSRKPLSLECKRRYSKVENPKVQDEAANLFVWNQLYALYDELKARDLQVHRKKWYSQALLV